MVKYNCIILIKNALYAYDWLEKYYPNVPFNVSYPPQTNMVIFHIYDEKTAIMFLMKWS